MIRTATLIACTTLPLLSACDSGQLSFDEDSITPALLADRISQGSAPRVLDVRTPAEYSQGHVPGALNIPHDALATRLGELAISQDEEVVVYCRSGRRAQFAEATLREHGYLHVRDLTGHWQAWQNAELPTE